jgi:hypothetical protein
MMHCLFASLALRLEGQSAPLLDSHLAPDKLAVKIMTIKSTTLIVTGGLNPRLIAKVY